MNKKIKMNLNFMFRSCCSQAQSIDNIPDLTDALSSVVAAAEPTLTSLGLGGWYPPGPAWIQSGLEILHNELDVPWWTAIVIGEMKTQNIIWVWLNFPDGADMHVYYNMYIHIYDPWEWSRWWRITFFQTSMLRLDVCPVLNPSKHLCQLPISWDEDSNY